MEQSSGKGKNFNIVSPTAKYVLLFKGNTDIPYAREVAEHVSLPEQYEPDFTRRDVMWWAQVLHFETRYKSIDQLLSDLPITNVLELSAGFSFRGLTVTTDKDLHYLDTDLPDMITTKKELMKALTKPEQSRKGILELLPLNALDEQQFTEIVSRFPPGEIAIVNEGLLMYLNIEEKRKLCANIRKALQQRGGYWITADIYTWTTGKTSPVAPNKEVQQIFDEMKVDENKFESFEAAERFFKAEGFVIDKEAEPDYANSTALKYLLASATEEQMNKFKTTGKIQATWRLKLAEV